MKSYPARAFVALLVGNVALAFGPWLVRLSEVGPSAAGFWRLALALPFLVVLARAMGQPAAWPGRAAALVIGVAAFFFAADLAAWHAGIHLTKLGNATLFGNVASFAFAGWGLWLARSWPTGRQGLALLLAAMGSAALMASSAELSPRFLHGDLLALLAGLLYAGYLIAIERVRGTLQPLPVLILASAFGAAMLLPFAAATGETIIPAQWTPLVLLALGSQVIGQGCLVYALGQVPPLVVGLALLTQPAVSAAIGWLVYGEVMTPLDFTGAAAIALALVLVRLQERPAPPKSVTA
ncbi:DMT family transporter [Sphingomonas astaxanthinifaciens]|uniref:Membrane protein n=1 Tax=Sphingomonas astaxanthinifaciens DSM 22298 TaxID=1123267 RepID=A0ABQ5Z3Z0_9SPHN|nr:DMT family transporter [Sphingomonas astaxanthinifaciens]GLR46710.1 membrane protein [Sphingomonas astaxanthinifaciens DSM 22298]